MSDPEVAGRERLPSPGLEGEEPRSGTFGASRPIQGSAGRPGGFATPSRYAMAAQNTPGRMDARSADELRALRAQNEMLQRQLSLKNQGLERLRQKVSERAMMLSHSVAGAQRRETDNTKRIPIDTSRIIPLSLTPYEP